MKFLNQADFRHDAAECLGVLLVNLGTPDSAAPTDVRRYLAEFLADPRVIEMPRLLWWLVLHGIILRIRPARSARAYQKVWTDRGSPLLDISRRQQAALQQTLAARMPGPLRVELAMRYGNPSIQAGLAALRAAGARRLLVLPLYPQYSATTTASVFDAVTDELQRWRWLPEVRFINEYFDDTHYIHALTASIRRFREAKGTADKLLFSFHGIPKDYFLAGDPYHCHCHKTARLVASALGLDEDRWAISFQSRVGAKEWLKPYTDQLLKDWGKAGIRKVQVVCPGFSADCLETLDEIAEENRDYFLQAGGAQFDYIPALNDHPDHIETLMDLIARHSAGWPETDPAYSAQTAAETLNERLLRARRLGAAQ